MPRNALIFMVVILSRQRVSWCQFQSDECSGSGLAGHAISPPLLRSASSRYMVGALTPSVWAIVGTGSPKARIPSRRVRSRDKLTRTSTRDQRPDLAALLDYARPGDAIVVVGIDRLGRNAVEAMLTIRDLGGREITLRSLREGVQHNDPRSPHRGASIPVGHCASTGVTGPGTQDSP